MRRSRRYISARNARERIGVGLYKDIRAAFDSGFEGDWRKCTERFFQEVSPEMRHNWYFIANHLKKYYLKRNINFGSIPPKDEDGEYNRKGLRVYKILSHLDDLGEGMSSNLDRTHRISELNLHSVEVAKDNTPAVMNHIGDQLADELKMVSDFVRRIFGNQTPKGLPTRKGRRGKHGNN